MYERNAIADAIVFQGGYTVIFFIHYYSFFSIKNKTNKRRQKILKVKHIFCMYIIIIKYASECGGRIKGG